MASLAVLSLSAAAYGDDRHAGYYYPEPTSVETYISKTVALKDADRRIRISFATDFNSSQLRRGYAPNFALFVKGEHAEKMIITALKGDYYDTLFRMRALLAMLTAQARETELFTRLDVVDEFNFFDMLKFFGFEKLTVTDGDGFAHQVLIK